MNIEFNKKGEEKKVPTDKELQELVNPPLESLGITKEEALEYYDNVKKQSLPEIEVKNNEVEDVKIENITPSVEEQLESEVVNILLKNKGLANMYGLTLDLPDGQSWKCTKDFLDEQGNRFFVFNKGGESVDFSIEKTKLSQAA